MHAVYDFVTEYKQNYYQLLDMEIDVFFDICSYLSSRNKKEKYLTQRQQDMVENSKKDEWWKNG